MRAYRTIMLLAAWPLCVLVHPHPAAASDNDERPAYMIYIDPETGKYTTEDPSRKSQADALATASPAPTARPTGDSAAHWKAAPVAVGLSLLCALAVWGIARKVHRRS
jgi:hypothetical protein